MHRATEQGGDRVETYDEQLGATARQRLRMEADLRRAVERDELVVHYQPGASLHDGHIVEVEALMPWQHPERGLVPPGEFIPLARGDRHHHRRRRLGGHPSLRAGTSLAGHGPRPRVAVNLSARQFEDPDLVDEVSAALTASGLDPAALILEVAETALIREPQHATTVLTALRGLEVRIAIDDFGTGYSALSYLRALPFDALKIGRGFIGQVGVETAAQLDWLRDADSDLAAGFHLARPQPPGEVGSLLGDPLIPNEPLPDATRRVLVIDDSPLVREVLRHVLHTAGPTTSTRPAAAKTPSRRPASVATTLSSSTTGCQAWTAQRPRRACASCCPTSASSCRPPRATPSSNDSPCHPTSTSSPRAHPRDGPRHAARPRLDARIGSSARRECP